jgi:Family of unknown function (DUF5681)
VSEKKRDY